VETPPKINEVQSKVVPLEVLPPEPAHSIPPPPSSDGPPIHPLSALILVAVDSLWIPAEFLPPIWIIAVPACFVATFIPTFLIQKHLKRDTTGRALAFASVLAVLAALPTPVMGTPVGLGLLAWTGLGRMLGRGAPK
jgi:integral membrane sensor domain MASE1